MRSRRFIAGISRVRPRPVCAPEPVVMPAPNRPVVVFEDLIGFTLKSVTNDTDMATFTLTELGGRVFQLYHDQNCCESVDLEEVIGDLRDLVGVPLLRAEERSEAGDRGESSTWTFYELATIRGSVTLRWLGESNGYYSESVSFKELS